MSRFDWKCSPVHKYWFNQSNIFHVNNRRGALCLSQGRRMGYPSWRNPWCNTIVVGNKQNCCDLTEISTNDITLEIIVVDIFLINRCKCTCCGIYMEAITIIFSLKHVLTIFHHDIYIHWNLLIVLYHDVYVLSRVLMSPVDHLSSDSRLAPQCNLCRTFQLIPVIYTVL